MVIPTVNSDNPTQLPNYVFISFVVIRKFSTISEMENRKIQFLYVAHSPPPQSILYHICTLNEKRAEQNKPTDYHQNIMYTFLVGRTDGSDSQQRVVEILHIQENWREYIKPQTRVFIFQLHFNENIKYSEKQKSAFNNNEC